MIKCGACQWFDCGGYCKCVCHNYEEKKKPNIDYRDPTSSERKRGAWDRVPTDESLEGLSSLFG